MNFSELIRIKTLQGKESERLMWIVVVVVVVVCVCGGGLFVSTGR